MITLPNETKQFIDESLNALSVSTRDKLIINSLIHTAFLDGIDIGISEAQRIVVKNFTQK